VGTKVSESLRVMSADLHIHTCLSPCGSLDMTPMKIVRKACERDLGIIAIADHNSAENAAAVMAAGRGRDLTVIPGLEITTAEEVHILGLFENPDAALSMQELVYDNLQGGTNDERLFGIQVVSNAFDEVERINKRLLIGATSLGLEKVLAAIHDRGGLAIAAHVDRQSFGILGQLGFIPPDLDLDAIEISKRMTLKEARKRFREYIRFPFVTSSDAHDLDEIGVSGTRFQIAAPVMGELKLALIEREGRKVLEEKAVPS